jgi:Co/Zn/Cd efflux system component
VFFSFKDSQVEPSLTTCMPQLSVGKRLITLGSIVLAYAIFELVLGFEMNSVTLVADGFHNIADAGGFAIAVLVNRAQVGTQDEYRAERIGLIGGLLNCSATLILCGCAGVEACRRLFVAPHVYEHPHIGPMYFFCAFCGMCINFFGAMFLGGHGHSHGGVPCKSHESPPSASPTLPLKTTVKKYQLLDDDGHAPEADHGAPRFTCCTSKFVQILTQGAQDTRIVTHTHMQTGIQVAANTGMAGSRSRTGSCKTLFGLHQGSIKALSRLH